MKNLIIMLYGLSFILLSISCAIFLAGGNNNIRVINIFIFSLTGIVFCTVAFFREIRERMKKRVDREFILHSFFVELDAISDNIGWVKVSELMEYGEDNYHLLIYPVELKEGTYPAFEKE